MSSSTSVSRQGSGNMNGSAHANANGSSNTASNGQSQTKRPSRWTGQHSFGTSSNPGNPSNATQNQAMGQPQSPGRPSHGHNHNQGHKNVPNSNNSNPNSSNFAVNGPGYIQITAVSEEQAKMHDRMLFLLINMIGSEVNVTLRSGISYSGILSSTSDADLSVCLRVSRPKSVPENQDGQAQVAISTLPKTLVLAAKDISDIYADNVNFDTAPLAPGDSRPTSPSSPSAVLTNPASSSISATLSAAAETALAGRDAFRTDTDISGVGHRDQRELQRWGSNPADGNGANGRSEGGNGTLESLDEGLESTPSKGKWDQFATNEKLFGARTNFNEELYTTKIDRSAADFKAREMKAIKLANEIQGGSATNAHIAEERGLSVDDSGLDEEDKYSGVLRSAGAYVPPGARRGLLIGGASKLESAPPSLKPVPAPETLDEDKTIKLVDERKVNGNLAQALRPGAGPQAIAVPQATDSKVAMQSRPDVSITTAFLVQDAASIIKSGSKDQESLVGDFKKFVVTEREKLVQKKQQLQRQDKDNRIAELVKFSQSFVLKTPIPADMVTMLSQDENKQKDLVTRKPSSGASKVEFTPVPTSGVVPSMSTTASPNLSSAKIPKAVAAIPATPTQPALVEKKSSPYSLSPIPPFNSTKVAGARAAREASSAGTTKPPTPSTSTTSFNAAAPSFVFRPGAATFTPGGPAATSSALASIMDGSSAPPYTATMSNQPIVPPIMPEASALAQPILPLNPFFGTRTPKPPNPNKPVHVKEDFSPFKRIQKVPDPASVKPEWGFTGKSFRSAMGGAQQSPSPLHTANSSAGPSHMMSPQLNASVPPHILAQQQQLYQQGSHPIHHQHHPSNTSNMSTQSPRNLQVRSPPPHHIHHNQMSRTPSNASGLPLSSPAGLDEGSSQKLSTVPTTPAPSSSSASQAGGIGQSLSPGIPQAGQGVPHMLPQGYAMYQHQPFPGAPYRLAAPGAGGAQPSQHLPGQLQQGQPGPQQMQQQQHITLQHGSQIPYSHSQAFLTQMPFGTQGMHPNQPMFSPQLANQMPPGQFMQHMFVAQPGPRGHVPQIQGGHLPQQHIYYQMQSPGMAQQFAMAPQGMPISGSHQPQYDQSSQ